MKKNMIYMAALAVMTAACSKEDDIFVTNPENNNVTGDVKMITETITATNGDDATRAAVDADAKFTWSVGDQIAVHASDGEYHTTEALTASNIDTTDPDKATFTVSYSGSRDYYAIFPASIADATNYGESTLNVTLPGSYTLAQVSGTTTPCPMIATNTAGSDWTFKQLCGLVRLTVKGIPSDAIGMVIQFPGKKVKGSFSVTDPGTTTPTIATSTPATGEDKITVTFDAGTTEATVNLPLPTGAYDDVYITPVGSSTKVAALRHIKAGGYTAARARAKKLTTTMVAFSVSASRKVIISLGNLQATYNASAQSWTWGFAAHQYDRIGNAPGNTTITTETKESSEPYAKLSGNGTVDLFGRSTANTYYGIATTSTASYYNLAFKDWGNIDIDGNGANYWFTLSKDEWCYLTGRNTCRSNGGTVGGVSNALSTKAIITEIGVKGFIIFPDNYSGLTPEGVTWSANSIQHGSYDNTEKGFATTIATLKDWDALEAEGCVFLPVTGTRVGSNVYFNYSNYQDWSCYWSSTDDGDAKVLRFNSDGFDPNQSWNRYYGESVRLVHEL